MKGFTDKPSYMIELLEGGVTLRDVIDGHICEQALVSGAVSSSCLRVRPQTAALHDSQSKKLSPGNGIPAVANL